MQLETDGTPFCYRIASILRSQLQDGDYRPGDRIPTENELIELYGVSRATIRQALTTLVSEGYLIRKKAKGTFVAEEVPTKEVVELVGDVGDLVVAASYLEVKVLSVDEVVPPRRAAEFLELEPTEVVTRVRRVRYHEKVPFQYVTNYLPLEIGRRIDPVWLESTPLMTVLERELHLKIRKGIQLMEAGRASAPAAQALGIPFNDPVLLVATAVYLADSTPTDLTEFVLRSDLFRYRIDLVRFPLHRESQKRKDRLAVGRWGVPE